MKTSILAICGALILVATALAQAPTDTNENYTVDKEWAKLPAGMTWDGSTSNVAADGQGNVVVLVRTAPFFRVFTRDGDFVKAWGEAELYTEPHSVMFDHEGFIWSTDSRGHLVYKFNTDGDLLMTLGQKGVTGDNTATDLFNRPNAVAIAPNGDIYVSDGYNNARVVHFNSNGQFLGVIGGTEGSEPGQLELPHGVVLDSAGRILVGDSANARISVFDPDGEFVETWDAPSRGDMVISSDDTVYVSDVNAGSISVLRDGELVETIPGLGRPHGLTLDSDGTLYASDSANRLIMKITPKN
jgi:peptidylamidoglycolate lyase